MGFWILILSPDPDPLKKIWIRILNPALNCEFHQYNLIVYSQMTNKWIMKEKVDFSGILNLDIETGSGSVKKILIRNPALYCCCHLPCLFDYSQMTNKKLKKRLILVGFWILILRLDPDPTQKSGARFDQNTLIHNPALCCRYNLINTKRKCWFYWNFES